jgi:hypothetical protein
MIPEKPPSLPAAILGAGFGLLVVVGLVVGAFARLMS